MVGRGNSVNHSTTSAKRSARASSVAAGVDDLLGKQVGVREHRLVGPWHLHQAEKSQALGHAWMPTAKRQGVIVGAVQIALRDLKRAKRLERHFVDLTASRRRR